MEPNQKTRVLKLRKGRSITTTQRKTGWRNISFHGLNLMFWAVAAVGVSGCAFLSPKADPTRFYVLTVPASTPARNGGEEIKHWQVRLNPMEVPAYLRTRFIVVRTGTNEIHFEEFERWAEPLDEGIKRVMEETLGSRNIESKALNLHGNDTLDYEVSIQILACEGVRVDHGNSSIRLAMSWEVRPLADTLMKIRRGGFTTNAMVWNGRDYGQLAERLSEAIAGAGKMLAADMPTEARIPEKSDTQTTKP